MFDRFARGRFALQHRAQRDVIGEQRTTAILDVHLAGHALARQARVIHEPDGLHNIEHPRTHRAGVHAERPADAAGNPFEKLQVAQPVSPGFHRHFLQPRPCAAVQALADDLHAAEIRMRQTDHHAANPGVFDEQVGAAAQHHERNFALAADFQDRRQFGFRGRFDVKVGRAADAQRGLLRQRLVASQDRRR